MEASGPKNNKSESEPVENVEIVLLVMAKRVGLSFIELNELSLNDVLIFSRLFFGVKSKQAKKAAQADIDRLLA